MTRIAAAFTLVAAIVVGRSASAATSTGSIDVTAVAVWIDSQPAARCFPELLPTAMFVVSGPWPSQGAQLPLNALRDDVGFGTTITKVPPSLKDRVISSGPHEQKIYAGYDGTTKVAAAMNELQEGLMQIVLANASTPPSFVKRGPLGLALNGGIRLGSSRSRVENYFRPLLRSPIRIERVSRCHLTAERYGTPNFLFVFVFSADSLVAYSVTVAA